jgi:hypothetical protein
MKKHCQNQQNHELEEKDGNSALAVPLSQNLHGGNFQAPAFMAQNPSEWVHAEVGIPTSNPKGFEISRLRERKTGEQ